MRPETTGSALLDAAQRSLADTVLPGLAGAERFAALLVGSAIRMVAREIEQAAMLADASDAVAAVAREAGCDTARTLVDAIRSGRFDADLPLHGALWSHAAVRVSVSKPSVLNRIERGIAALDPATPSIGEPQ